jgi:hypothetical protein
MDFEDAGQIPGSGDIAAADDFNETTSPQLTGAFKPVIFSFQTIRSA